MRPANPAMAIILMGLILNTFVPMNVATNRNTLTQNCQGFSLGVEKFSLVHSSSVAAANSPTTAGRKPRKMLSMVGVCMYLRNILAMRIISMNDGSTNEKVDTAEPSIAVACCLELDVVHVDEVDMVDAQTLHALVDAVGDALGRVVPRVDAVLAVASHLCAQVVLVARNIFQCLAQHRLGLVVAVVGTDVDEVDAALDGGLYCFKALFLVGLAKHAAQRRSAEADVGNLHSRLS